MQMLCYSGADNLVDFAHHRAHPLGLRSRVDTRVGSHCILQNQPHTSPAVQMSVEADGVVTAEAAHETDAVVWSCASLAKNMAVTALQ